MSEPETWQEAYAVFSAVRKDPAPVIRDWKARTGGKAIGCLPMHVPEELVYAAGALPVQVLPGDEPITLADEYVDGIVCHPLRASLDAALRKQLDFLDGVVFADVCDPVRRGSDVWRLCQSLPFVENFRMPRDLRVKTSRAWIRLEIERLSHTLEQYTGRRLDGPGLRAAVSLYGHYRALMAELYQLRRQKPSIFTLSELETVVIAGMLMPKEEYCKLLANYLRSKALQPDGTRDGVRLVIWGNPCEDLEPGLAGLIDSLSGLVIEDHIHTGRRYFTATGSQLSDPLERVVETYLNLTYCPMFASRSDDFGEQLIGLSQRSGAQGVLLLLPKYCQSFSIAYPPIKRILDRAGVPSLMVESDHAGASARVHTRIEAFLESVRLAAQEGGQSGD